MLTGEQADFFGRDPVAGDAALEALAAKGLEVIKELLPLEGAPPAAITWQIKLRLKRLCEKLGPGTIAYLVDVIDRADWRTKILATPCFAAFKRNTDAERLLYQRLKAADVDVQRMAIEALGYAGSNVGPGIAETARYGKPGYSHKPRPRSRDSLERLSFYAIVALIRLFGQSGRGALLKECEELHDARDFSFDIDATTPELLPVAADELIERWLRHEEVYYRQRALRGLAELRLRRTIPTLARVIEEDKDAHTRLLAGIALGNIPSVEAARHVVRFLRDGLSGAAVDWAFSMLHGVKIDWPDCSAIIRRIRAAEDDETYSQLLYSRAIRGDRSCLDDLTARLRDEKFYIRGPSAIAIARLLHQKAQPLLKGLEREASHPDETLFVLTAQIHAGMHGQVDALHRAAQDVDQLPSLRPLWKREVLAAFLVAEGARSLRARLWAEIAREDLDRVTRELGEFGIMIGTTKAPTKPLVRSKPKKTAASRRNVFVSYSRKDKKWLEQFQDTLAPLVRKGAIELWDDTKLTPGSRWRDEIDTAMAKARVALLLVSKNFLKSDFVVKHELKTLLRAAKNRRVRIVWIAIDHSLYEETELKHIEAINDPRKPLADLSKVRRGKEITEICREIRDLLEA